MLISAIINEENVLYITEVIIYGVTFLCVFHFQKWNFKNGMWYLSLTLTVLSFTLGIIGYFIGQMACSVLVGISYCFILFNMYIIPLTVILWLVGCLADKLSKKSDGI